MVGIDFTVSSGGTSLALADIFVDTVNASSLVGTCDALAFINVGFAVSSSVSVEAVAGVLVQTINASTVAGACLALAIIVNFAVSSRVSRFAVAAAVRLGNTFVVASLCIGVRASRPDAPDRWIVGIAGAGAGGKIKVASV